MTLRKKGYDELTLLGEVRNHGTFLTEGETLGT